MKNYVPQRFKLKEEDAQREDSSSCFFRRISEKYLRIQAFLYQDTRIALKPWCVFSFCAGPEGPELEG